MEVGGNIGKSGEAWDQQRLNETETREFQKQKFQPKCDETASNKVWKCLENQLQLEF